MAYLVSQPSSDPSFAHPTLDGAYYAAWAKSLSAGQPGPGGAFYLAPLYPHLLAILFGLVLIVSTVISAGFVVLDLVDLERPVGFLLGLVAVAGDHPLAVSLPPGLAPGDAVQVAVRPESLRLARIGPPAAAGSGTAVPGKVAEVTFLGNLIDCHITLDDGTRIRVQAEPGQTLGVGQRVGVHWDGASSLVFPP